MQDKTNCNNDNNFSLEDQQFSNTSWSEKLLVYFAKCIGGLSIPKFTILHKFTCNNFSHPPSKILIFIIHLYQTLRVDLHEKFFVNLCDPNSYPDCATAL